MYRDTEDSNEGEQALDLLVSALREVFGERAIDVAERQQGLAHEHHVQRTWQMIAEQLRHP